jgi:arginase family enzyme
MRRRVPLYTQPPARMILAVEPRGAYLDLDGAWDAPRYLPTVDARGWGPRLRYLTRTTDIEAFAAEIATSLPPFVLYGSGDFHHLTAVLVSRAQGPLTIVCFDNHPDWDRRPPRWACGGWVNRALELPHVQRVSVWGCGNFELAFPSRLFGNRSALRSGQLEVHAWAERQPPSVQRLFPSMTRADWRQSFSDFCARLAGQNVYVTVDLDCLRAEEAATNWESGLFSAADVAWAIAELRRHAPIVAGDVCGAYSAPICARRFQRFASWWDHPRLTLGANARDTNLRSLGVIWPALLG